MLIDDLNLGPGRQLGDEAAEVADIALEGAPQQHRGAGQRLLRAEDGAPDRLQLGGARELRGGDRRRRRDEGLVGDIELARADQELDPPGRLDARLLVPEIGVGRAQRRLVDGPVEAQQRRRPRGELDPRPQRRGDGEQQQRGEHGGGAADEEPPPQADEVEAVEAHQEPPAAPPVGPDSDRGAPARRKGRESAKIQS